MPKKSTTTNTLKRRAKQVAKKGIAKAKIELGRHARALKLAAKRYQVSLKNS